MNISTYFEIGGEIVETVVLDSSRHQDTTFDSLPEFSEPGKFTDDELMAIAAGEFVFEALNINDQYEIDRALRSAERFRRAYTVAGWAIALAAADGPLPIGDTIAIVLLASWGIYETALGISDIVQYGTW